MNYCKVSINSTSLNLKAVAPDGYIIDNFEFDAKEKKENEVASAFISFLSHGY